MKNVLSAYSGCGKVGMEPDGWLKTVYKEPEAENSVEFDFRDGMTRNEVRQGSSISKPNPIREGYDFDGWYILQDGMEKNFTQEMAENVSGNLYVYAKWRAIGCTITMDLNGAVTDKPTSITCKYNDAYNLRDYNGTSMSKEGLYFQGWYSDKELTKKVSVVKVKGDMTLYAKWTTRNTLTCELNGGRAWGGELQYLCFKGEAIDLSKINVGKTGYYFSGWYLDEELTQPIADVNNVQVNEDMTVYAKWTPEKYVLTLVLNDGVTDEPTEYVCDYDSVFDLTKLNNSNITKEGYYLEGWYSTSKYTRKITSVKIKKDTKVYAKWVEGTPPDDILLGDINDDGKVDLNDAMLALRAALNVDDLTEAEMEHADCDNSGTITLTDVQIVLKKALHILGEISEVSE